MITFSLTTHFLFCDNRHKHIITWNATPARYNWRSDIYRVSIEHGHCSVGVSGLSNLYPCIGSVLMKCYDKQKIIGLPPAFILWVCIHTSCYGVSVARGHLLVDSRVRDLRHITHWSVTARRPLRRGSF